MLPAALHFCVTQQVIGNHSQHKNTREMLDDTLCAIRLSSLLKDWGADLTSCCPFLLNFATFYFPISNFKIMPFDYYQTYAKNEDTCLFTKDWTSQIYFSYIYYISTVSATRAQTVVAFLLIMGVCLSIFCYAMLCMCVCHMLFFLFIVYKIVFILLSNRSCRR